MQYSNSCSIRSHTARIQRWWRMSRLLNNLRSSCFKYLLKGLGQACNHGEYFRKRRALKTQKRRILEWQVRETHSQGFTLEWFFKMKLLPMAVVTRRQTFPLQYLRSTTFSTGQCTIPPGQGGAKSRQSLRKNITANMISLLLRYFATSSAEKWGKDAGVPIIVIIIHSVSGSIDKWLNIWSAVRRHYTMEFKRKLQHNEAQSWYRQSRPAIFSHATGEGLILSASVCVVFFFWLHGTIVFRDRDLVENSWFFHFAAFVHYLKWTKHYFVAYLWYANWKWARFPSFRYHFHEGRVTFKIGNKFLIILLCTGTAWVDLCFLPL